MTDPRALAFRALASAAAWRREAKWRLFAPLLRPYAEETLARARQELAKAREYRLLEARKIP